STVVEWDGQFYVDLFLAFGLGPAEPTASSLMLPRISSEQLASPPQPTGLTTTYSSESQKENWSCLTQSEASYASRLTQHQSTQVDAPSGIWTSADG
ncbi:unnamed protein product, partial [Tilletia laevis]